MGTKVKFLSEKYGNYQDSWYTNNYQALLTTLLGKVQFTCEVNLGVTDGVVIENNFNGDFSNINCAIVEHDTQGTHLYKLIKKAFIKRGLWRVTMVKDLVSSKYTDLINSKVLVSRLGISRQLYDPILFQKEVLDLSEVKTSQELLNEIPGVKSYGYLAIWKRDSLDGNSIIWKSENRGAMKSDISVTDLQDYANYDNKQTYASEVSLKYNLRSTPSTIDNDKSIGMWAKKTLTGLTSGVIWPDYFKENYWSSSYNAGVLEERIRALVDSYPLMGSDDDVTSDLGKVIFESSTGNYYEITRKSDFNTSTVELTNNQVTTLLGTGSWNKVTGASIYSKNTFYEYDYNLLYTVPVTEKTFGLYANTIDQPFQMFYIPIIEGGRIGIGSYSYMTNRTLTESMLYDLISAYSGTAGKLVDVQLIPYSPVDGFRGAWNPNTKVLDTTNLDLVDSFIFSGEESSEVVAIFNVNYASYSTYIPYNITFNDYKLEQKKKYILTSPSGSINYDFSVAKNGGLDGFYVEVDLRPFASFHRLQPNFKNLYGSTFKDTRGLIWQEDTSLTQVSDAWETYRRQNINYLNSFNTEQNYKRSALAIDQEANIGNYNRDAGKRLISAGIEAATFAAEAVAQDVFLGVKGGMSGGVGAAAIMGGALLNEAIEREQLAYNNRMDKKKLTNEIDYSRQQFNYNIGNIKAIPENVEKVNGVYSTNNFVPYIQVFTPTAEEEEYYSRYLDLYGVNCGMMVDLSVKEFNYLQGVIVLFSSTITNEEYDELQFQLKRGCRLYEEAI